MFKRFRDNSAAGEAPREEQRSKPSGLERGRMRRRLRRQQRVREALLLDLGALVFELHRQGRREPELLQSKASELAAVDQEVRALAEALDADESVPQLVAAGIVGSCESCGALLTADARYCSNCGTPTGVALEQPSGEGVPGLETAGDGADEADTREEPAPERSLWQGAAPPGKAPWEDVVPPREEVEAAPPADVEGAVMEHLYPGPEGERAPPPVPEPQSPHRRPPPGQPGEVVSGAQRLLLTARRRAREWLERRGPGAG